MDSILVRDYSEIKEGNCLMYYPEANVLVSRHVDPQSRTPAFKGELVRVVAAD
jgi:anaerobic selenocysteine-containing dehydrogenase